MKKKKKNNNNNNNDKSHSEELERLKQRFAKMFGGQPSGSVGSARRRRRKAKKPSGSNTNEHNKLQNVLKRLGVQSIPGIETVEWSIVVINFSCM